MTTASTMNLTDPSELARFLVNLKLYMGLETSFGKSIEGIVLPTYPIDEAEPALKSMDPPEKLAEFEAIKGLAGESGLAPAMSRSGARLTVHAFSANADT